MENKINKFKFYFFASLISLVAGILVMLNQNTQGFIYAWGLMFVANVVLTYVFLKELKRKDEKK